MNFFRTHEKIDTCPKCGSKNITPRYASNYFAEEQPGFWGRLAGKAYYEEAINNYCECGYMWRQVL